MRTGDPPAPGEHREPLPGLAVTDVHTPSPTPPVDVLPVVLGAMQLCRNFSFFPFFVLVVFFFSILVTPLLSLQFVSLGWFFFVGWGCFLVVFSSFF